MFSTDKKEFYKNIESLILSEVRHIIHIADSCDISYKNIADILGVSPLTICSWYKGTKTPSLKHYLALQSLNTVLSILVRIKNE